MKPEEVHDEGGTSIVLFSGGLDSLAGALHELNDSNRHVVLVSHRNLPTMGRRQGLLAERLARDFPKRVTHVWVDNSLTSKLESDDETHILLHSHGSSGCPYRQVGPYPLLRRADKASRAAAGQPERIGNGSHCCRRKAPVHLDLGSPRFERSSYFSSHEVFDPRVGTGSGGRSAS